MFHSHSTPPHPQHQGRHGEGHDRRHARGDFWPGGGRHDGGMGQRHGGGRMGRLFAHGDLHFVILNLIAEKPRHGYEIIKAIEEMVGGTYSPSPGTIYPTLTMLEDQGSVTVETTEGARKLYTITGEGRAYLDANRTEVEALLARMARIGAEQGGAPPSQVIRAVENLRLALRLKLAGGRLTEDQVRAVTQILDRAATEIERT